MAGGRRGRCGTGRAQAKAAGGRCPESPAGAAAPGRCTPPCRRGGRRCGRAARGGRGSGDLAAAANHLGGAARGHPGDASGCRLCSRATGCNGGRGGSGCAGDDRRLRGLPVPRLRRPRGSLRRPVGASSREWAGGGALPPDRVAGRGVRAAGLLHAGSGRGALRGGGRRLSHAARQPLLRAAHPGRARVDGSADRGAGTAARCGRGLRPLCP
jgi:hypothetical protein